MLKVSNLSPILKAYRHASYGYFLILKRGCMAPGDPKFVLCRGIAVIAAGQADLVHLLQGQKNNGRCRTSVIDFKSNSSGRAGLPTV